ncbi:Serine/threonine-protein kinase ppk30 [Rhypophila decipiens]
MASYGQAVPAAAVPRPAVYGAPAAAAPVPGAPAGTFAPGTKIQVGGHKVVILRYLSEGGFAHVYLVKLQTQINGTDQAVLKRVAVPDKESLRGMRTEVETIKRLKGHKAIVTYIDSHASELRTGGYEVFLLMEYCNGGGLIDFMNTRLQHRLTEPEILNIFTDVAEGVACMHYLKPPLLHRDLKVENVLISVTGGVKRFKLCDFGSAAPPRAAPTTTVECRLMDEDVQKHTTMQYRSPEMIDVYRKQPIDEKSDIWALGVLLYKLCYYTTPFEEQGQLAILNASYRFPSYPVFSERLKKLIAWTLRENQQQRPNIYQVLKEACAMQGREPPVKDIYSGGHADSYKQTQPAPTTKPAPAVGAVFSPNANEQRKVVPEVERMRRGRLPATTQPTPQAARPSKSPGKVTNGDPFAALDAKAPVHSADELSSRFPTLDQFSILHEHGTKFDFDSSATQPAPPSKDLSQRVAERLADEAFQTKPSPSPVPQRQSVELRKTSPYMTPTSDAQRVSPPLKSTSAPPKPTEMSRASAIISSTPELQAISSQASQPVYQPTPNRPVMVSTGTMTTPPPERELPGQYQVYRFPPADHRNRASSLPRQQETGQEALPRGDSGLSSRPNTTAPVRTPSFQSQSMPMHVRHPSSSRPSLEGGRPDLNTLEPNTKPRPTSGSVRPRPVSTHLESNLDYLRAKESNPKPLMSPRLSGFDKELPPPPPSAADSDGMNIESNVDFLRSMEDDPKKKDKIHIHKHSKRSSLTSLGAGTKNILAGKFGDAFKRFEGGNNTGGNRTPSPLRDLDLERRDLTPIAGSEATDGRSDFGDTDEMTMTPEMRREQEAKMLAAEEARVAAAQAEYRSRVQAGGSAPPPKSIGGVSRAVSIQNKVQSLLDESSRSRENVVRTAQGYGHFSERPATANSDGRATPPVVIARKPTNLDRTGTRPAAPPKPVHLNKNLTSSSLGGGTGGVLSGSPPKPSKPMGMASSAAGVVNQRIRPSTAGAAAQQSPQGNNGGLMSATVNLGTGQAGQREAMLQMTPAEKDDYIRDFQKRFPSLGAIEMVERDLGAEAADGTGTGMGQRGGR